LCVSGKSTEGGNNWHHLDCTSNFPATCQVPKIKINGGLGVCLQHEWHMEPVLQGHCHHIFVQSTVNLQAKILKTINLNWRSYASYLISPYHRLCDFQNSIHVARNNSQDTFQCMENQGNTMKCTGNILMIFHSSSPKTECRNKNTT